MRSRKNFLTNTFWIMFGRIFQMIMYLFVGIFVTRYLGPENNGILNYSLSLINIFTVICALGLDSVILNNLVNEPEKKDEILSSAIVLRIVSGIIAVPVIFVIINILKPGNKIIIGLVMIQSLSLLIQSLNTYNLWFQKELLSKKIVLSNIISSILSAIVKVVLIFTKSSVISFGIIVVCDALFNGITILIIYNKMNNKNIKFNLIRSKNLLKRGYHFILSGLLVVIYTQIDKLMIGSFLDDYSVGIYSVAVAIANMWMFIPQAIINSAFPIILEAKNINNKLYNRRLKQLYACIIWGGGIISLVICVFSKVIVFILYGNQYITAVGPLSIIVWSNIFALLGSARGIWIVAEGKEKFSKYCVAIGAIINVILNFMLIDNIGSSGAALATLITQIVVAIFSTAIFKETRISTKLMLQALILKDVLDFKKIKTKIYNKLF